MTLKFRITEWFLRWLISWGAFIDGITGIITFGHWYTHIQIYFAEKVARYRAKAIDPNKFMKEVVEQQHRIQDKRKE